MTARILSAVVPGAAFLLLTSAVATFAQPTPKPKPYVLPDTLSPQSHPAPTATPVAGELKFSGRVRAYDFQRLNHVQNASNPNRHAFELGAQPHLDYRFADSNFNLGYTYGGATPFGFNGPDPIANPHVDNTIPGYPIDSPIHELYLQYKDARATVTAGNQELNYPWTPNSDSRIMPAAYQGIDSSYALSSTLTFGLTRIVRFEQRNSSNFVDNTLLTAPYPGASSLYKYAGIETPGTLRVGLNFKPATNVSVLAENYSIYDIANLTYAEAKLGLAPRQPANPYLAVQYVAENSLGQNQIGRVDDHTIGAQLGVSAAKGLLLAVSTDVSPWHYAYVNATSTTTATKGFFVGGGGTGDSVLVSPGIYKVAYGGIASPYTDSLGTDPLYTTMITQGMADRRSAGNSYKTALVYTTPSKQLKLIAAEAWFQYSNEISRNLTSEFNVDGTYYFNKVRPGPYKGFFVRVRIAPRTQPSLPYNFEYQRFITEYDF